MNQMKFVCTKSILRLLSAALVLLLLGSMGATDAQAQFENKWLTAGSLHQVYNSAGAETEFWARGTSGDTGNRWPGIMLETGTMRANTLWIAAKNFTDPEGTDWNHKVVHVGPRVTGQGEFFPTKFEMVSRFEPPAVKVDGLETFNRPYYNDAVDSKMKAARKLVSESNTLLGLTMKREIKQFSQGRHDNYHVVEYTFTNTGNTDDDPAIELEGEKAQTLEGVYVSMQKRRQMTGGAWAFIPGDGWGAGIMNDVVGDGMEDYNVDFRAEFSWLGNSPNADIDPLGAPVRDAWAWFLQEGDTVGRLGVPQFAGTVMLHVDDKAYSSDTPVAQRADDETQPSVTGSIDNDHKLTASNDAFNKQKMRGEYNLVSGEWWKDTNGHQYPHHADIVDKDGDFTTPEGDPKQGLAGGLGGLLSFGPYDIKPGESVKIVVAEAVDGLNPAEAKAIGSGFKQAGWDPEAPIEYDANDNGQIEPTEKMGKNDWWFTGRDSLFATFERAIGNFKSSYSIPQAPKPPKSFSVNSGVGSISLQWSTFDGEEPAGGFEVYRTQNYYEGDVSDNFQYQLIAATDTAGKSDKSKVEIAKLSDGARSFEDTNVSRGIDYYYYIVSVGAENTVGTAGTPTGVPLKSSRYYTQTYDPAQLKRKPGADLSDVRVVPNPYDLASKEGVRWPGQENRLGFLDVPAKCTIEIFTETGELIRTIEHTDGSGDEYWNLNTSSVQIVASGIYLAVIKDHETGEQVIRKFVIMR